MGLYLRFFALIFFVIFSLTNVLAVEEKQAEVKQEQAQVKEASPTPGKLQNSAKPQTKQAKSFAFMIPAEDNKPRKIVLHARPGQTVRIKHVSKAATQKKVFTCFEKKGEPPGIVVPSAELGLDPNAIIPIAKHLLEIPNECVIFKTVTAGIVDIEMGVSGQLIMSMQTANPYETKFDVSIF